MAFSPLLVKRFVMALLLLVLVTSSVSVEKVSAAGSGANCIGKCDEFSECTFACVQKGFLQGHCVPAGVTIYCCCL
ncbi:hypothetical protein H6P81_012727 [Aristolochia fimbriata]|uniref:Uncharacterized protein n=1 Tax=Aristolochia fimbriata TaxID=158543 RepID=A0AAV7ED03_ARIFI|nr:hypothetical protein H6P81_012727 [Aristolochia fimbriata]